MNKWNLSKYVWLFTRMTVNLANYMMYKWHFKFKLSVHWEKTKTIFNHVRFIKSRRFRRAKLAGSCHVADRLGNAIFTYKWKQVVSRQHLRLPTSTRLLQILFYRTYLHICYKTKWQILSYKTDLYRKILGLVAPLRCPTALRLIHLGHALSATLMIMCHSKEEITPKRSDE